MVLRCERAAGVPRTHAYCVGRRADADGTCTVRVCAVRAPSCTRAALLLESLQQLVRNTVVSQLDVLERLVLLQRQQQRPRAVIANVVVPKPAANADQCKVRQREGYLA